MRLTYNILWIENEVNWLEPNREFVEEVIEEHGFKFQHIHRTTEKEIEHMLQGENPLKEFDLILVDFALDSGDRGSSIIENIRKHNVYTEVLFYSQDLDAIRQAIKEKWVDGVYTSSRNKDDFQEKFEKVFLTTIRKIQQISSMRGLVLSETSQLDVMIEDIIATFLSNSDEETNKKFKAYVIQDCIINSHNSNSKKIEKLTEEVSDEELINHRLFDSYKKMRSAAKILKILNSKELISPSDFHNQYKSEVIDTRNDLAHAHEVEQDGVRVLMTRKGQRQFDENTCVEIRNSLKKHQGYLIEIKSALTN